MKIYPPELSSQSGSIRISAKVELQAPDVKIPERIWYEFPEAFEAYLHPGMEAFVTALLPLAMAKGESIEVIGPLSPQFSFHIHRVQQMYRHWFPDRFTQVKILSEGFHEHQPPLANSRSAAVMFSGGVDSFYTLLRHLPGEQLDRAYQVHHGIFLFHFDLGDQFIDSYQKALLSYQVLFESLGLELIPVNFNASQFQITGFFEEPLRWLGMHFTLLLSSVGQLLSNGLSKLIIASATPFPFLIPTSSDMRVVQALSTEWLEVIHHGLSERRVDKIKVIAGWKATYPHLRVCFQKPDGPVNCCRCPKCIRTMVALEAFGALKNYQTFPQKLRWRDIIRRLTKGEELYYIRENLKLSSEQRRWDLMIPLILGWLIGKIRLGLARSTRIFTSGGRR